MNTRNGLTLLAVVVATLGCADDHVPTAADYAAALSRAPATAGLNPGGTAVRGAPRVDMSKASAEAAKIDDATAQAFTESCGNNELRGVTDEFPWAQNPNGGLWEGTGTKEPKEMAALSDSTILQLAGDTTNTTVDREHALVSLGRRKLDGAMDIFARAQASEEPRAVREMALSGLIEHGGAKALELMWNALREDPSSQIRGMAVWAVSLYGASEAHAAIMAGLADEALGVQNMAMLAVWALKDKPEIALPILTSSLKDERQMIWQEAHYNLSRMPYAEAGRALKAEILSATDELRKISAVGSFRSWERKFPELARDCN